MIWLADLLIDIAKMLILVLLKIFYVSPVYKPVNDMILIPAKGSFDDEYEFVSAVLHECCHSTMKENRLGRSYPNLKTNNERYAF